MTIAALSLLSPSSAYAKRKTPAPVPPVVWQGLEYRAPLDLEQMGRVQAFDVSSGRQVWETRVYQVWIIPLLEEDVQWVFVSALQVLDGKLLVRNEDGKIYRLDLKTGRVDGFLRSWFLWFLAGCLPVSATIFIWIRRRGVRQALETTADPSSS